MGRPYRVTGLDLAPGVCEGVTQAEGKLVILPVDFFDCDFQLLSDLQNVFDVFDPTVRNFRDRQKTFQATYVNECPEVTDVGNRA